MIFIFFHIRRILLPFSSSRLSIGLGGVVLLDRRNQISDLGADLASNEFPVSEAVHEAHTDETWDLLIAWERCTVIKATALSVGGEARRRHDQVAVVLVDNAADSILRFLGHRLQARALLLAAEECFVVGATDAIWELAVEGFDHAAARVVRDQFLDLDIT